MIDYELLRKQFEALAEGESNSIGLLANLTSLIRQYGKWHWVGFYLVNSDKNVLELGPFQGPPACMTIPYGRGVCGSAWELGKTVTVPDVEQFPGHIACSTLSKSEIVVPLKINGTTVAVLDIDSDQIDTFTSHDAAGLEKLCDSVVQFVKFPI